MANSLPLCSPKTRYPRKHTFKYLCASLLIAMAPDFSLAHQDGKLSPSEILDETARNGERVVAALKQYSYYSELTVQSVKLDGVLAGEYDRFEKIYPDKNGGTGVHVIEQKSTMPEEIFISSGAIENMSSLYRFILTPDLVRQYDFNYIGRERIDEIDSLVFDVRPKGKVRWREGVSERYLKGRIWIDEVDLQVVKASGEIMPQPGSDRTPRFETYFQNYDSFWFPAYTLADDDLRTSDTVSRVTIKLRFTGYKKEVRLN